MTRDIAPQRLDVRAFAESAATLEREEALTSFPRLADEAIDMAPSARVAWRVTGELRSGGGGAGVPWLELDASTTLPLVCQRCLAPVEVAMHANRWFRFVPDEATAELEDESADEDVLAESHEFDLRELIEDELLMEIPVSPRHDVCPVPVALSAQDADFDGSADAPANPFAVLGKLRSGNGD